MIAPLKGLTGCMNRIAVLLRPDPDTAERLTKAQAQVREFIIHMRRNDRMHGTGDQPSASICRTVLVSIFWLTPPMRSPS